jgi:glucosamine--fructose-6-phosphate aminotransferase (isomerizing)
MCGIVGYIGAEEACPVLINGLKKLEYRGYDSAGVAVLGPGGLGIRKSKGALKCLEEKIDGETNVAGGVPPLGGTMGIGHPLGYPRGTFRYQFPSPYRRVRKNRGGP